MAATGDGGGEYVHRAGAGHPLVRKAVDWIKWGRKADKAAVHRVLIDDDCPLYGAQASPHDRAGQPISDGQGMFDAAAPSMGSEVLEFTSGRMGQQKGGGVLSTVARALSRPWASQFWVRWPTRRRQERHAAGLSGGPAAQHDGRGDQAVMVDELGGPKIAAWWKLVVDHIAILAVLTFMCAVVLYGLEYKDFRHNPFVNEMRDVCFGVQDPADGFLEAVGPVPNAPGMCKDVNVPQVSRFIWVVTDGFGLRYARDSLRQFDNRGMLRRIHVPGYKFSHAIYTSFKTGIPAMNYQGQTVTGDSMTRAFRRRGLPLHYHGPWWSLIGIEGGRSVRDMSHLYEGVTLVDEHEYRTIGPYPELRNEEGAYQPFLDIMEEMENVNGSIIFHTGVIDKRNHFYRTDIEVAFSVMDDFHAQLKQYADDHPDVLLMMSADHGFDETGLHGSGLNGNVGWWYGYWSPDSPLEAYATQEAAAGRDTGMTVTLYNDDDPNGYAEIVDVMPTITSFIQGLDFASSSCGFTHRRGSTEILSQNVQQLLDLCIIRRVPRPDGVSDSYSVANGDKSEKELVEMGLKLREKLYSSAPYVPLTGLVLVGCAMSVILVSTLRRSGVLPSAILLGALLLGHAQWAIYGLRYASKAGSGYVVWFFILSCAGGWYWRLWALVGMCVLYGQRILHLDPVGFPERPTGDRGLSQDDGGQCRAEAFVPSTLVAVAIFFITLSIVCRSAKHRDLYLALSVLSIVTRWHPTPFIGGVSIWYILYGLGALWGCVSLRAFDMVVISLFTLLSGGSMDLCAVIVAVIFVMPSLLPVIGRRHSKRWVLSHVLSMEARCALLIVGVIVAVHAVGYRMDLNVDVSAGSVGIESWNDMPNYAGAVMVLSKIGKIAFVLPVLVGSMVSRDVYRSFTFAACTSACTMWVMISIMLTAYNIDMPIDEAALSGVVLTVMAITSAVVSMAMRPRLSVISPGRVATDGEKAISWAEALRVLAPGIKILRDNGEPSPDSGSLRAAVLAAAETANPNTTDAPSETPARDTVVDGTRSLIGGVMRSIYRWASSSILLKMVIGPLFLLQYTEQRVRFAVASHLYGLGFLSWLHVGSGEGTDSYATLMNDTGTHGEKSPVFSHLSGVNPSAYAAEHGENERDTLRTTSSLSPTMHDRYEMDDIDVSYDHGSEYDDL